MALKLGEKLIFGFAVVVAAAAVAKGVKHMRGLDPAKPRNYYEWSEAGLDGLVDELMVTPE